jgi:hypothetical protein
VVIGCLLHELQFMAAGMAWYSTSLWYKVVVWGRVAQSDSHGKPYVCLSDMLLFGGYRCSLDHHTCF